MIYNTHPERVEHEQDLPNIARLEAGIVHIGMDSIYYENSNLVQTVTSTSRYSGEPRDIRGFLFIGAFPVEIWGRSESRL